jgi:hypothetical protein
MLLMAHSLTGGRWGVVAGPGLGALTAMLPLAALGAVPVLIGLPTLYPWARPEEAALLSNTFYLDPTFFILRTVVYFVLWILLALLILRASEGRGAIGAPGLVILAITGTLAPFDWMMSLEPLWSSTIFGMFVIATELNAALAAAILVAVATGGVAAQERRLGDLASLLIAGALLWGYLGFMQFVIIWEEDIPAESAWYLRRFADGWGAVTLATVACEFAIPFLMLLWWPLKRRPFWVALGAAAMLAGYLLLVWVLVYPAFGTAPAWFAPFPSLALLGFGVAIGTWALARERRIAPALPGAAGGERHA